MPRERVRVCSLQESLERVVSLEKAMASHQRAATVAQRALEQARAEGKARAEALEAALASARQEAAEARAAQVCVSMCVCVCARLCVRDRGLRGCVSVRLVCGCT